MEFRKELQQIINECKDKPLLNVQRTADTQKDSTQEYEMNRAIAEVEAKKEIITNSTNASKVKISEEVVEHIDGLEEVVNKICEREHRIVEKDLHSRRKKIKAIKGIVKGFAITLGILFLLANICGMTDAILLACGINIFG